MKMVRRYSEIHRVRTVLEYMVGASIMAVVIIGIIHKDITCLGNKSHRKYTFLNMTGIIDAQINDKMHFIYL